MAESRDALLPRSEVRDDVRSRSSHGYAFLQELGALFNRSAVMITE